MNVRSHKAEGLILLSLALFLVCAIVCSSDLARQIDYRVQDSYVRLQPRSAAPDDIALVLIDDRSLQEYGRWPWSRELLAQLVRKVGDANPRVMGVDILLSEQQSEAADVALANAFRSNRRTVLVAKIGTFPDGPRWIEPLPMFSSTATIGHAQAILDPDGVCRRFPVLQLTTDGVRYAFGVEIARQFAPEAARRYVLAYTHDAESRNGLTVERPSLASIAYRRTDILTLSAAEILHGRPHPELEGRAVLIGFGPSEISDRLTTPLGGQLPTPGVEIHAQILNNVLRDVHLRSLAPWWSLAVLFALAPLLVLTFRMVRGWRSPLVAVALAVGFYLSGYVIFRYASVAISPLPLIMGTLFAPMVVYAADFAMAERRLASQARDLRHWLGGAPAMSANTDERDLFGKLAAVGELQIQLGSLYELHDRLLQATDDAVAVFDSEGRLLLQNNRFLGLLPHLGEPMTLSALISSLRIDVPIPSAAATSRCEVTLGDTLYGVRVTTLPSITLAENGGTMVTLSSLQMRVERDRARAEALRFVTHELRTPIVAIQGFSELMMRMPISPACEKAPETIFRESQRLLLLINSYLDVLRIESGGATLRCQPVDVNEIVDRTINLLTPLAQAANMRLHFIRQANCSISGDETLLTGAVLNLLSNAIKYGRSGTQVEISSAPTDSAIIVSMYNQCAPVSNEELECLFDLNYRSSASKLLSPGWGIGLAFVKRIAENHRGTVRAESLPDGIRFELRLPRENKGAAVAQV